MAEIIWSALAKEHLREIDAYIAKGSPFYAIIFIDKLIASVEKIALFPQSGRVVPECHCSWGNGHKEKTGT